MVDTAISQTAGGTFTTVATGDFLIGTDTSDTTENVNGTTKKLPPAILKTFMSASPALVTPALGTPASGVMTNVTGTASGLTAGNVTTNANLTGHITSTGNAAILGAFTVAQLSTALSDASISGNNTGDEVTATATTAGVLEIMTAAEYRNKTASKIVTPDIAYSAAAEVTITDAATIAIDLDTFINGIVTLGGNRTLGNPTNTDTGQSGYIRVVQDGTGSRTLAFGTSYEFAGGTAPTMTTTASADDILLYTVISATRILISNILDIS